MDSPVSQKTIKAYLTEFISMAPTFKVLQKYPCLRNEILHK